MEKEKKFIKPKCEIIVLHIDDIITDSINFPGKIDEGNTNDTPLM